MTRLIRWFILEILIILSRIKEPFGKRCIPVFVYHSIDESGSSISITPDAFEQHLAYLRKHKYDLLSSEAAVRAQKNKAIGRRCVVFTFDDAYTTIEPWLENLLTHKQTATVFVPSSVIGQSNLWDKKRAEIAQIDIMTAEQLQNLAQKGCELGSHTCTHPNLTELTGQKLDEELQDVITELQEKVNLHTTAIAYPYGAHNDRVIDAAQRAGYTTGFTTQLGYLDNQTDLLKIPRFPTNISFQVFRLIVHGGYGWYRKLQDRLFG